MIRLWYSGEEIKMRSVKGDYISSFWERGQFYESRLLEKIKSYDLKGTYVDVGAHHGNHSVFFDKFCNSDKVISIEGNPYNFSYLEKNIEENKCKNVLVNKLVSDKEGEQLFMKLDTDNTGSSTIISSEEAKNCDLVVTKNTTVLLDNILSKEENISLIKLDVEDHEFYALKGCLRTICIHWPMLIIELAKGRNPYYFEIIKLLTELGYSTDGINYAATPTYIFRKS